MRAYLVGLLALAACATTPAAPAPEPNGGSIIVFSEPEGSGVLVEVYASSTPDELVVPAVGDGHCDVTPTTAPIATVVDRDLGAALTATDGTSSLTAPDSPDFTLGIGEALLPQANRDGSLHFYGAAAANQPSSGTWTIATSDGPLAKIFVPAQVQQQEISLVVASPADHVVHFSGAADAQYLEIDVGGAGGTAACYPVHGATSFTVPDDVIAATAGTDHLLGVNVFAKNRTFVTVGGRRVLVTGQSQNLD